MARGFLEASASQIIVLTKADGFFLSIDSHKVPAKRLWKLAARNQNQIRKGLMRKSLRTTMPQSLSSTRVLWMLLLMLAWGLAPRLAFAAASASIMDSDNRRNQQFCVA